MTKGVPSQSIGGPCPTQTKTRNAAPNGVLARSISAIVRNRNESPRSRSSDSQRVRDGGKMGRRRFLYSVSLVLTTSAAVAILATAAWAAGTPQVIYSFAGEDGGEYTDTDL